jgi:hypothetical protein
MFHMSSLEKLQQLPTNDLEEVQGGSLTIGASPAPKAKSKKSKQRGNKSSRSVAEELGDE